MMENEEIEYTSYDYLMIGLLGIMVLPIFPLLILAYLLGRLFVKIKYITITKICGSVK